MKIVIHTQYYPPEVGAPQGRLFDLAKGLQKRGHQVTVLTAVPSYPQGKIYPGYHRLFQMEQQQGIRIIRTWIFATQKVQFLPRLLNYFSFVITSLVFGGLLIQQADYWITESPPLFLGISGFLLSRWKKARWIFNVSDLWPDSAVRLAIIKDGLPLRLSSALEAFCYQRAWLVTGQSRGILLDIKKRFPGVPAYHLSNGVDTNLFCPAPIGVGPQRNIENNGMVTAIYAGLHGLAQGLDQLLAAAGELQELKTLHFLFVGDGPEKSALVKKAQEMRLSNVSFQDPVPREQMPGVISAADICLVPLKCEIPGAVPSKIYEAMACAKPILLIANGEAAQIVASNQAGLVVEPGNIGDIIPGLVRLAGSPELRLKLGGAGRTAAEKSFDRSKITESFAHVLEAGSLAGSRENVIQL